MNKNPIPSFKDSPETIRLDLLADARLSLPFCTVADLLRERGIDVCHQTLGLRDDRLGKYVAGKMRKRRSQSMQRTRQRHWHLDEVFKRRRVQPRCLWRASDPEGDVHEACIIVQSGKAAVLKLPGKAMDPYGYREVCGEG